MPKPPSVSPDTCADCPTRRDCLAAGCIRSRWVHLHVCPDCQARSWLVAGHHDYPISCTRECGGTRVLFDELPYPDAATEPAGEAKAGAVVPSGHRPSLLFKAETKPDGTVVVLCRGNFIYIGPGTETGLAVAAEAVGRHVVEFIRCQQGD